MVYREVIPVFHCFNDQYAVPAGAAFLSMLEHANPDYDYLLYVAGDDFSKRHKDMLYEVVSRFQNARLEFVLPEESVVSMFSRVQKKGAYSKEIVYKLMVARMFPQWSHMIVTDVDCVYMGDISKAYHAFKDSSKNYLAGISYENIRCSWIDDYIRQCYGGRFSEEEMLRIKSGVGAGYMIYNLEAMRADRISEKLLECFLAEAKRIVQPEQDVINLVCGERIDKLPFENMVCSYLYDKLPAAERDRLSLNTLTPIQLHYATRVKPWNNPRSPRADVWWEVVRRTPFYYEAVCGFDFADRRTRCSLLGWLPLLDIWHNGRVTSVSFLRHFRLALKEH